MTGLVLVLVLASSVVWCGEAVDCVSEASVVVFSVFDGITLITFRFSLPGAYI